MNVLGKTPGVALSTVTVAHDAKLVFEFISDYILTDIPESYNYIELYYPDVKKVQQQYKYLQKIVYT